VESLFLESPLRFLAREARDQVPAQLARLLRR
jgi:hypothetical protein